MSKERLEDIVDDLLNNRLELTSFVSESLEQAERVQELEEHSIEAKEDYEYLSYHYGNAVEQNKRYREAIEYIKIELRDFRKEANTIKKLSRDRIVQGEAFRLSCDIRDCLKALEQSE